MGQPHTYSLFIPRKLRPGLAVKSSAAISQISEKCKTCVIFDCFLDSLYFRYIKQLNIHQMFGM